MKIPEEFSKFRDEILSYIESPMFFIYDNELINLYSYLSRLSDSELQEYCRDDKFKKMCDIVKSERKTDFGKLSQFVNERGMLNIQGLLPILSSFPTFDDAMNFIMRIKPGFRYTPEFQQFVNENLKVEDTVNVNGEDIKRYTLGRYKYEIHDSENFLDITYYKDDELHRINGPAIISLVKNTFGANNDQKIAFSAEWYINGKESRKDGPALIKYSGRVGDDYVEEIYKWYTDGKLNREDGPAVLRILKAIGDEYIRNSRTLLTISRDSDAGREELERRNNEPKEIIIRGEGDSIVEEYWRNGKRISV